MKSGNIIDFSAVVGVEELDGVLPGRKVKASRVLAADAVLDCRGSVVIFHVGILGSPELRPEWWGSTDDGLSMSLECKSGVRVQTETVEDSDGLTFRTLEDGGVEALLVCRGGGDSGEIASVRPEGFQVDAVRERSCILRILTCPGTGGRLD